MFSSIRNITSGASGNPDKGEYEDNSDEEDSYSVSSDEDVASIGVRASTEFQERRMSTKAEAVAEQDMYKTACRAHFWLAASVAFWLCIVTMPMYYIPLRYVLFGQRGELVKEVREQLNRTKAGESSVGWMPQTEMQRLLVVDRLRITCASTDYGKMVNTAPAGDMPNLVPWNGSHCGSWMDAEETHIWCGFVPSTYLSNWPNLGTFIVFTVFKNTGTTVRNALQGIVGTVLAGMNMHLMILLFPSGARGFPCVPHDNGEKRDYYVVWYSRSSEWHVERKRTLASAWDVYSRSDIFGGLYARCIYHPDGTVDPWAKWFSEGWEEKTQEKYESLFKVGCQEGEMVYDDPNYAKYGVAVCFFDFMLVVFLFLISRSPRSSMLFGLSWTVYWMMNFMNPALGVEHTMFARGVPRWMMTEYFVVEVTCMVGGLFATLTTFVPGVRLLNRQCLVDDLNKFTLAITDIWDGAVSYLCGQHRSAKRFHIATLIDSLDDTIAESQEHIDGAWWETFNLGSCGRQRKLLRYFENYASDIKELIYVVKECVASESFGPEHNEFIRIVQGTTYELLRETQALMWILSTACTDGLVDEEETDRIRMSAAKVRAAQSEVLAAFQAAAPPVSKELAEEQLFLFALSMFARKMTDFADDLCDRVHVESDKPFDLQGDSIAGVAWQSVKNTWDPKTCLTKDHILYALRNWLAICLCFLIGYHAQGTFFDRYSPIMAQTLALLSLRDGQHIVEYEKCTKRLLGVTLGKSLPIVLVSVLTLFPCVSHFRVLTQAILIWVYVTTFMFVYYNSDTWSYIANLVAGFGVSTLIQKCNDLDANSVFVTKYKELGSVTVAIFIQGFLQAILKRHSARQLFVEQLRKLTSAIEEAFEAALKPDFAALDAAVTSASSHLAAAKELAPECDPKLYLYRGSSPPFDTSFCISVLRFMEILVAELRMIIVASKDWQPYSDDLVTANRSKSLLPSTTESFRSKDGGEIRRRVSQRHSSTQRQVLPGQASVGILELMHSRSSLQEIRSELVQSLQLVAEVLPEMFEEKPNPSKLVKLRRPEDVLTAMQLVGADALYQELAAASNNFAMEKEELTNDLRVRMTIVVRSLQNAAFNLGKIEEECIKHAAKR